MTAPKPVPCSTKWKDLWCRSRAMALTIRIVFTPASPSVIPRRPSLSRRASAVPSQTAEGAPTQRDRHLQLIAEKGRMVWQRASGYTKRARAEAALGRWKQVIGDRLRAHTDEGRATEVEVAGHVLNRMLDLG